MTTTVAQQSSLHRVAARFVELCKTIDGESIRGAFFNGPGDAGSQFTTALERTKRRAPGWRANFAVRDG